MTTHASFIHWLYIQMEFTFRQIISLFGGPTPRTELSVEGKIILITGANSGLGMCTAEQLAKRGANIIMACRNIIEGEKAMREIRLNSGSDKLEVVQLDLADLSSIRNFAARIALKYPTIDILVNNAGVFFNSEKRRLTKDGFEIHMGTNHLGHFLLTNLLLENIKKSTAGRIVTVASIGGTNSNLDVTDLMMNKGKNLGFANSMPYYNSKFANAIFNKELSKKLHGSRIKCYAVCPGLVKSNIIQHYTAVTKYLAGIALNLIGLPLEKGVDTILYCCLAKEVAESSGEMYRFGRKVTSAESSLTDSLGKPLWEISSKLVGL